MKSNILRTWVLAASGLLFGNALGCDAAGDADEAATTRVASAATYDHDPVPERELLITDVSVVDDARLTRWRADKFNTDPEGGWSFGRLMANLSPWEKPTPRQLTDFVVGWLKLWEVEQRVGLSTAPARPAIRDLVINPWRQASGCTVDPAPLGTIAAADRCLLDFSKAPFRLLAIVNRPDLRIAPDADSRGMAGQGRFVFGALGRDALGAERRLNFTVIFEYQLPISGWSDIISWAERWHKLGKGDVRWGSDFNDKLHTITRDFTKWNLLPGAANGSALLQIRTNEVSLSSDIPKTWEMREFVLSRATGRLVPFGLANEPDGAYNGSAVMADLLNANADAVRAGRYQVPSYMLAARALVLPSFIWQFDGVPEDVRQPFALGTCSGCHFAETGGLTGTNFLHVRIREAGRPAALAPFLVDELHGLRRIDFATLLKTKDKDKVKDGPGLDHGQNDDD